MNHLLDLGINLHHARIEIGMIPHQHIRIPRRRNKYGVDAAADGGQEDLTDLQADEEGKGHDDGREGASGVVFRLGELQVEVGEEGAEVGHECGTHGQDGTNQAIVDERVDAAVFHHSDGGLVDECFFL